MGDKYMAFCAYYPFKGYVDSIQSRWLIPFIIKVLIASRRYSIIDIKYRNIKEDKS